MKKTGFILGTIILVLSLIIPEAMPDELWLLGQGLVWGYIYSDNN